MIPSGSEYRPDCLPRHRSSEMSHRGGPQRPRELPIFDCRLRNRNLPSDDSLISLNNDLKSRRIRERILRYKLGYSAGSGSAAIRLGDRFDMQPPVG
jgi:hypothetical protein